MFTGIVEELGTVIDSRPVTTEWGAGVRLRIAASTVLEGSGLGASIAVNGCCLTLVDQGTDPTVRGGTPMSAKRPSTAPPLAP